MKSSIARLTLASALAAFGLAAVCAAPALAQTSYILTDLGAISGGDSLATDISPTGRVTGQAGGSAALWTPNGQTWTFQNLGLPSSSSYMLGFCVTDSPAVAASGGNSGGSTVKGQIGWENGFLWSGGRWADLTGKTKQSEALGVNSLGAVAGLSAVSGGFAAGQWQNAKFYALPGVPVSGSWASCAISINDSGQIVGYYGGGYPFLWTPSKPNGTTGGIQNLGLPAGRALGINNAGAVVGDDESGQAFVWSPTSGLTRIGSLPGYLSSSARKVNSHGVVVGNSYFDPNRSTMVHGFIWDQTNMIRDLNSLSIVGGIPPGWVFTCDFTRADLAVNIPTISINDAGQICGTATVTTNGVAHYHAFVLTPAP